MRSEQQQSYWKVARNKIITLTKESRGHWTVHSYII